MAIAGHSHTFSFIDLYRIDGWHIEGLWQRYNVRVHWVINPIEVIFASVFEGLIMAVIFPELVRPGSLVTVTQKVTFVSPLTCGAMNDGDGVSAPFNETTSLPTSLHEYFNPDEFLYATAILRITLSPFVEGLGLTVIDSMTGISSSGLTKIAFVSRDFLVSNLSLIELLCPELSYIFELRVLIRSW